MKTALLSLALLPAALAPLPHLAASPQGPSTTPPAGSGCDYMCESIILAGTADDHLVPPATCVTDEEPLAHAWRRDYFDCNTCPNTYCLAGVEVDATDPAGTYTLLVNTQTYQFPLGNPVYEVFRLSCNEEETIEVRMRWAAQQEPPAGYGTAGYAQDFEFHCQCVE